MFSLVFSSFINYNDHDAPVWNIWSPVSYDVNVQALASVFLQFANIYVYLVKLLQLANIYVFFSI